MRASNWSRKVKHFGADLSKLAAVMLETGLTREDVAAYMGGNFIRVFKTCCG
jgi:hypothetical protein